MLVASSPILVFQESSSQPVEFFAPGKPAQWPALALAKYREYNEHETNTIFYGSNHFNLVDTTTRRETSILEAFLVSPTTAHARLLSHMSLSFPALEAAEGRPEVLGLAQDGMRALKLLQDNCANLTTLEFYVHEGNAFGLVGEPPSDLQSTLSRVDAQLKVVSSLKRIVIRYYYDRPSSGVMQSMQGFGWIVLMGDKDKRLD
ncbi:cytochrome P450 1A2 [Colletotrichum plurivorum]|uniref:Cytochrome P450 1A2 n=1 Tax=Colletotrichum plurivorum TaxID=2175906 RepID=A0A8H6JF10_9PEZI|nr:cytochrome P450 1A2 [Colletotrichum plurivorum]